MRQSGGATSRTAADAGSVSLFLAVLFVGFLLLAGMVLDSSRAVHANAHASDLAAKAARAGAQEIDPASLRAGSTHLDPQAARKAALKYLSRHHVSGQVRADRQLVSVTVTWPVRFRLLAPVRDGVTVTQTRTAAPVSGP